MYYVIYFYSEMHSFKIIFKRTLFKFKRQKNQKRSLKKTKSKDAINQTITTKIIK